MLGRWSMLVQSLNRPYPVSIPMIVLVSLVPLYIFIAERIPDGAARMPELALDRALPLQPTWALIYGSLYLFLIVLPVFIVREREHLRRTVWAYLTVWIVAYACFLLYPTAAPRPMKVFGEGFTYWGLRILYAADPPYNCFPSIHVAHSFVSALTCYRVHRGVGVAASFCAALVALSTLFTKQHYVLDVIAGAALAGVAYVVFLRSCPRDSVPQSDRRIAPLFAVATMGLVSLGVACFWVAYQVQRPS